MDRRGFAKKIESLRGRRIMIAEDQPFLAFDLAKSLEDAGAEVCGPFYDAEQTVRYADSEELDAAILDFELRDNKPVTNAARRLVKRGVPFLVLSGYDAETVRRTIGPDLSVMVKPVDANTVLLSIAEMLAAAPRRRPDAPRKLSADGLP